MHTWPKLCHCEFWFNRNCWLFSSSDINGSALSIPFMRKYKSFIPYLSIWDRLDNWPFYGRIPVVASSKQPLSLSLSFSDHFRWRISCTQNITVCTHNTPLINRNKKSDTKYHQTPAIYSKLHALSEQIFTFVHFLKTWKSRFAKFLPINYCLYSMHQKEICSGRLFLPVVSDAFVLRKDTSECEARIKFTGILLKHPSAGSLYVVKWNEFSIIDRN